jgi:FKBP-type peptidyl-prolyl cis-trans isomerase FklB
MRIWIAVALVATVTAPVAAEERRTALTDQVARESYSLGFEFAEQLKRQGVEVQADVLAQAIHDAFDQREPLMSRDEMRVTLLQARQKAMVLADRRVRERAAKNLEDGRAFLEKNKAEEGVVALPSGLQYQIVREGTGPTPKATDAVRIQYRGVLIDGTEFDASDKRPGPAVLHVNGVIKGWTEALQLMRVGSKWRLFVPPELAYGERSFGRIPANSTLVFDLELLSIEKAAGPGPAAPSPEKEQKGTSED